MSFVTTTCPFCGGQGGVHSYGCSRGVSPSVFIYPLSGWICPRCQQSNASWVAACTCSAPPKPVLDPYYARILAQQGRSDEEQCRTCKGNGKLKCMAPRDGRPCKFREPTEGHTDMRQCARCAEWGRLMCAPPPDGSPCKNHKEIPKTPEELLVDELKDRMDLPEKEKSKFIEQLLGGAASRQERDPDAIIPIIEDLGARISRQPEQVRKQFWVVIRDMAQAEIDAKQTGE